MFKGLSISPATIEQAVESRSRSYDAWGRPFGMEVEGYLDRKNDYGGYEMAKEGRWTTWVLAPRDDPETLDFMCSCETLRRETVIFTQASSSYKTESEVGYGVASVFTPPHNRGKGYAKHMMRLLHWVLAPAASFSTTFPEEWGQPPAIPEGFGTGVVSVLYSDVGREFYKAAGPVPGEDGWVVGPHVITTWNLATSSLNASNDAVSRWTFLGKEQLQELWERDSELILDETPPNLSSTNKKAFTFLPRKGLGEYLYRRTDWFVNKMESPPKYWGMESKLNVGNTFVSWSYETYPGHPKTLLVTRLRCPRQMLVELISVLVGYAKELGIDKVQAWNLSDELKEESSKIGGDSVDAEEHLASAKWYGGGDSTVEWLNSEKFAWC